MTQRQIVENLDPRRLELISERLVLRPLSMDDVELMRALWSDPEVMRYIGDMSKPEEVEADVAKYVARGAGGRIGMWSVALREGGAKIGYTVLLPMPIEVEDTDMTQIVAQAYPRDDIEVGYVFGPEAWGNGYATEACRRMLDFAFEHTSLDEVLAVTDPENVVSQRVLRKSGMADLGPITAYSFRCPGFRMTRSDWSAARA